MKAIEINEKQKEMLLEMCKALYPELTDLVIRDSMEDFCLSFEHICIEYGRDDKNFKIIHWFEFCMTSLTNKLAISDLENYNLPLETYMDCIVNKWHHPVDYLYKQFKELKL